METSNVIKETLERKKVKKRMSKAQMQLAIIKKKQCDAKALKIVEQLLEPKIDSQWLICNLRYINKNHMEDVIEERAIIKLCGYVLCNNALTTIIDQQYHISVKKNKVYDVTRRKNFCSSCCYGACNYLLEQMLTSPLWLRDTEEIPEFKILTKDELKNSIPGDEICMSDAMTLLNSENKDEHTESNKTFKNEENKVFTKCSEIETYDERTVKDESTQIKNISDKSNILKELINFDEESKDIKKSFSNLKNKDSTAKEGINDNAIKAISAIADNTLLNSTVTQNIKNVNNATLLNEDKTQNTKNKGQNELSETLETEHNVTIMKQNSTINKKNIFEETKQNEYKECNKKNSGKQKQSNEFYNLTMHIEYSVREWITEDTVCLLLGKEDIKNRLLENIVQHERYLHLCKKLNKLQLEDEKDDHVELTTNTLKPLPRLSVLQEEGKKMELKVRAFYKGSVIIENTENTIKVTERDNDFTPVLPLTDAHAPKILRRRIFLDKLNRILPDLLHALASNKLPQYACNSEKNTLIKALVNSFSLSATNIIFKTAEWNLVGLIIIKMLSMMDQKLKFLLSTKQASMYISMILMSYKLDSNYLDRLVMELLNSVEAPSVDNSINSNVV